MSEKSATGSVVTFYSYKGGTGRSMALANVACLLAERASTSKPILMIDWDLEAPGLHRFFHGRLRPHKPANRHSPTNLDEHPGLIEFFWKLNGAVPQERAEDLNAVEEQAAEVLGRLTLDDYLLDTDLGPLQLIKAGAFDSGYATRVNTFNWDGLHTRSPFLFTLLAQKLSQQFSHVLIDSRTGLTDTSGICTSLMPEKLIVVFTPNRQSLGGVTDLVRQALEYRGRAEDARPLLVYPLPSRIESTREDLRKDWRYGNPEKQIDGYESQFEKLFKQAYSLPECSLAPYFNDVQIQQSPDYAYGEEIATLLEKKEDRFSLKHSYKTFCDWIESGVKPWERLQQNSMPLDEVREIQSQARAIEQQAHASAQQAKQFQMKYRIAVGAAFAAIILAFAASYMFNPSVTPDVSRVESVAVSANGQFVAACRFDGQFRIWDNGGGGSYLPWSYKSTGSGCSQIFYSEAVHAVVVTQASGVSTWTSGGGSAEYSVEAYRSALSPEGSWLVAASRDSSQISLVNLLSESTPVSALAAKPGWSIRNLAISDDGGLVAAMTDKGVLLWLKPNVPPASTLFDISWLQDVVSIDLGADGKTMIACQGGQLVSWSIGELTGPAEKQRPVPQVLYRECGNPTSMGSTGEFVATQLRREISVLKLRGSPPAYDPVLSYSTTASSMSFGADGSTLAVGDASGRVRVWSLYDLSAKPEEIGF